MYIAFPKLFVPCMRCFMGRAPAASNSVPVHNPGRVHRLSMQGRTAALAAQSVVADKRMLAAVAQGPRVNHPLAPAAAGAALAQEVARVCAEHGKTQVLAGLQELACHVNLTADPTPFRRQCWRTPSALQNMISFHRIHNPQPVTFVTCMHRHATSEQTCQVPPRGADSMWRGCPHV